VRKRVQALVIISAGARLPVSDIAFELLDKDFATFCEFVVKPPSAVSNPRTQKSSFSRSSGTRQRSSSKRLCDLQFFNHTHLLEAFDVPILILASIGDRMVPIDISREVAKAIQHSKIVEYKWNGHMPISSTTSRQRGHRPVPL
jgi:pimeloyl-ACP methyl ester carboxylesterase